MIIAGLWPKLINLVYVNRIACTRVNMLADITYGDVDELRIAVEWENATL